MVWNWWALRFFTLLEFEDWYLQLQIILSDQMTLTQRIKCLITLDSFFITNLLNIRSVSTKDFDTCQFLLTTFCLLSEIRECIFYILLIMGDYSKTDAVLVVWCIIWQSKEFKVLAVNHMSLGNKILYIAHFSVTF